MIIFKYQIPLMPVCRVELPVGAKVLSVQMQHGAPFLWALVNDGAPREDRTFAIFGTGQEVPSNPGEHIATIQDGPYVWHVFEVKT